MYGDRYELMPFDAGLSSSSLVSCPPLPTLLTSLCIVRKPACCAWPEDYFSFLLMLLYHSYLKLSAYDTKFFISLFERAFKMMKNGVYFIVIAFLFAELQILQG